MATRLKTVQFAFPVLASAVDNTLTTFTQITVYLPETGTKTFRSVIATLSAQATNAAGGGNIANRTLQCRLGAAAYTAHTNTNLWTSSGEDVQIFHAVDLTSHFTTNWSGTSMTMDAQVQIDLQATTPALTNLCVTVDVTYEYDDTSTTQIKTVRIPLDMPVTVAGTAKPGTALATIPLLNTELPEASKVYRSEHIIVQGNVSHAGSTTDITMTLQLDATASHTSGIFEAASGTDYFFRYVWDCSAVLDESITMGWYWWASVAHFNHCQAWLVVTYEFDATSANDVFVSLVLPVESVSPMGGATSSDYQRAKRELFIQEPGTITTKQVAFYAFWNQSGAIAGLNMRAGTGSFVAYTDAAAVLAGSNAAMVRNDAAFTLTRGRNSLNFDVYRTDTTDRGTNFSGFWIVNYTADKPTAGHGSENHTVLYGTSANFDGTPLSERTLTAFAPAIPESDFYMTAIGTEVKFFVNSTVQLNGVTLTVERLTTGSEGGAQWDEAYADVTDTDPETGLFRLYSQVKDIFNRWPSDTAGGLGANDRIDIETSRRWRIYQAGLAATAFHQFTIIFTYHSIIYDVSGTVSGYVDADGAGLTVGLYRAATGELVKEATTTTGGDFAFTWYDNTEDVFAACQEDPTHVGRSASDVAV